MLELIETQNKIEQRARHARERLFDNNVSSTCVAFE